MRDVSERISLLRLRQFTPVFLVRLDGPLVQKNRSGSDRVIQNLRQGINQSLIDFRWSEIPRANLAVSFAFFSSQKQPPGIHNLVKFYMDELRQYAFRDDRQVACLEVEIFRNADQERVYIKVERLSDYTKRFDATFDLEQRLSMAASDDWPTFEEIDYDLFEESTSAKVLDVLRRFQEERRQRRILGGIDPWDRPGMKADGPYGALFRQPRPLSIDLGNLPRDGESRDYKERIRRAFQTFDQKYNLLRGLRIPVAIDIAVFAKGAHVSKDLDNIMRDIAPLFTEALPSSSLFEGYRIYVAETGRVDLSSDSIRAKFLPADAMFELRRQTDRVLERAQEEIDLS